VPLFRVWVTSTRTVTTVRPSLTASLVLFDNSFFSYFVVTDPKHGKNKALLLINLQGVKMEYEILSLFYVVFFHHVTKLEIKMLKPTKFMYAIYV